jgi:hypothetical protein
MRKSRIRSEMSIKISPYLRGFGQRPVSDTVSPKTKKGQGLQDLSNAPPVVLAAIEVDERRIGRPKGRRFLYAFLQNPPCPGAGAAAGAGAGAESADLVTAPSSSSWNNSSCGSSAGHGNGSGSGNGDNTSALNSTAGCGRDSTTTTTDTDTPTDVNNHVRMCSLRSYMEWTSAMPKLDNFVKPPNYKYATLIVVSS